ncbi:alpha/beta fold hydrolase [Shewanella baltica]|uniref:alpha/beta hydrolase n=1 Tax=Shewanella baltica TaxID=62322 RepID=UPI00217DBE92|nr:alpha/beta hydrolase [Shewanella baltica]MCS6129633.1 alpha/beta fold hydrolase [Shewanella baltica]MCS6141552.1 alpha/beta fold hydrolase [Shewanella baltica]MCS6147886.1 alpha/beta fold hydrolase [Shewanella baltica]MCS6172415.1 alpha/beta fold hydrolase [Shewanella baltica]MCS6189639.1 alpha/beta fold hydrolase [Shewanella baltica]
MIDSMTHRKLSKTAQRPSPTRPRHGATNATWCKRMLSVSALMLAMASTATWASDVKSQQTQAAADIANNTDTCYVEGVSDRLNCGFVTVPENPNKPDGKQIQVHYVVLPAVKNVNHEEALLAIAGGPGQSAIDNAAGFDAMLSKVRQQRDILLIDQRGTGRSNLLTCDEGAQSPLSFNDDNANTLAETQKCLAKIDADVTQYGSLNAIKDFEAVRQHLGYKKLHIYGISYGTRMAQLYMRLYPAHLATVTLDGIVPMQQSVLEIGASIDRGFDLLFKDCQETTACHAQFPELKAEFDQVAASLAKAPVMENVYDPVTGEKTMLTMTRGKFYGSIRMALYQANVRALVPHAIHQAAKHNFQPILGLYSLTIDNAGMAMGMHASVVCGEDMHRITPAMREQAQHSFMGRTMLEGLEATCEVWKVPAVDDSFSEPISSDIPTLLLSGEIDPATPPSWGELAMEKLTNAKHFVAPYATHGVAYQSCANNLIADLVRSVSVKDLDGECLKKDVRRSFYLNASSVEPLNATSTKTTADDNASTGAKE